MAAAEKPLVWIGSGQRDLMALPIQAREFFGHALDFAQRGIRADAAKALKGVGGAGVLEVVADDAAGTYRAVYIVKFAEAVCVLHCFQTKSKRGIPTPTKVMNIIHVRRSLAEAPTKELRHGHAHD